MRTKAAIATFIRDLHKNYIKIAPPTINGDGLLLTLIRGQKFYFDLESVRVGGGVCVCILFSINEANKWSQVAPNLFA